MRGYLVVASLIGVVMLGSNLGLVKAGDGCTPEVTPIDTCTLPPSTILTVPYHAQKMSQWCWAASAQMVMDFLKTTVQQCTEANNYLNLTICCNGQSAAIKQACDQTGDPQLDKYGFTSKQTTAAPLTWEKLQSELACKQRPVLMTQTIPAEGYHMMVVVGYDTSAGNSVVVNDPKRKSRNGTGMGAHAWLPYDEYRCDPGVPMTHGDDYYAITNQK